jgi:hypothetical protein
MRDIFAHPPNACVSERGKVHVGRERFTTIHAEHQNNPRLAQGFTSLSIGS